MKPFLKRTLLIMLFIMIAAGACLAYDRWIKQEPFPDGLIQANGRVDGDHLNVSGKFPGRVQELLAREGDPVKQDQILVRLDDIQTQAKVSQAKHVVDRVGRTGQGG
jgi:HlyD family secretion protein